MLSLVFFVLFHPRVENIIGFSCNNSGPLRSYIVFTQTGRLAWLQSSVEERAQHVGRSVGSSVQTKRAPAQTLKIKKQLALLPSSLS